MQISRLAGACLAFLMLAAAQPGPPVWGFYGHKKITRMAIYALPEPPLSFFKRYHQQLIELSVAPDSRRYVVAEEGPRHYIDLDDYAEPDSLPLYWPAAVARYGEDTLQAHGIVPWYAYYTYKKLIKAFAGRDGARILRLAADLSHYVADAHVPLHTTANYNGQLSGQEGIHAFWETRLPQLFSDEYDFVVGRAEYVEHPQERIWAAVRQAHALVDSVLLVEAALTRQMGQSGKYAYEDKGRRAVRVYSKKFARTYHDAYPVVEGQMRAAIKLVADLWYTAWIEAGQPDLRDVQVGRTNDIKPAKASYEPQRQHEH